MGDFEKAALWSSSSMMEFLNIIYSTNSITKDEIRIFLILLNPFAPHITKRNISSLKFGGQILTHIIKHLLVY